MLGSKSGTYVWRYRQAAPTTLLDFKVFVFAYVFVFVFVFVSIFVFEFVFLK